jgi:hypothetical protein
MHPSSFFLLLLLLLKDTFETLGFRMVEYGRDPAPHPPHPFTALFLFYGFNCNCQGGRKSNRSVARVNSSFYVSPWIL